MRHLLLAALLASFMAPTSAQEPSGGRLVRFQVEEGTRMNPDLSPDGRRIVFDLLGGIYTMPATGGPAVLLTDEDSINYRPALSPDGSRIAWLSERSGTLNVWVMDADGANAINVTQQDALERPKRHRFFITPTWTPDGRAIVVSTASEITYYGSDDVLRFEVPARASSMSTSPAPAESLVNRAPLDPLTRPIRTAQRGPFPGEGIEHRFSADGSTLFFSRRTSVGRINGERIMPQWQIGTLDLHSRRIGTLTDAALGAFSPAPSPDGRWLVYAQRDTADAGLRLRDLRDGTERWLVFPLDRDSVENWHTEGLISRVSFASDSRSIVTSFDGKLWRVGIPGGERQQIPFSADIVRRIAPGSRTELRLHDEPRIKTRQIEDPTLSPDQRLLAFSAMNRIWIMDVRSGRVWRATLAATSTENHPAWSPRGDRLVFAGFDTASRRGHLFEVQVGSKPLQAKAITKSNGYYSRPSYTPDGKALVAVRADVSDDVVFGGFKSAQLVLQPLHPGEQSTIAHVTPGRGYIRPQLLQAEPGRVFYYEPGSGLVSVSLTGGEDSDRRIYLRVRGLGMQKGDPQGATIADAIIDPSGQRLLLWSLHEQFGTIFTAPLDRARHSNDPQRAPVIEYDSIGRDGLTQVSGVAGGVQPFWSGSVANFLLGSTVFQASGERATQRFEIDLDIPTRRGVPPLLLTNARIVTMKGDEVIERGDILIRDKRIEALGPSGSIAAPAAHRIDLTGATIVPGLIDIHAHETSQSLLAPPDSGEWLLANRLAYGVTTVFDPASEPTLFKNADLVEAGDWAGARTLAIGPELVPFRQLGSLDDARELVRRNSRYYPAAAVKSYDIGGSLNRRWIVQAAREQHINVAVESEGSFNYTLSLAQEGHQHLAHGFAMPVYQDFRKLMIAADAGVCFQFGTLRGEGGPSSHFYFLQHELDRNDPKLNRFMPAAFQYGWWRHISIDPEDNVFRYYSQRLASYVEEGGRIAVADHGTFLGLGMHWELLALGNAMSPRLALRAATSDAAYIIGVAADLGTLEPGKKADLIVLNANPLQNLRAISDQRHVMRDGELFDASTLEQLWPEKKPAFAPWWREARPTVRPDAKRSGGVNPF